MFSEVEGNCKTPDQETQNYRLNHTMIRVKDPAKSVDFYTRIMGMKLLRKIDFPAAKFSLYFLGSFDEKEVKDIPETDDERRAWVLGQKSILELTHNYGTEDDKNFTYEIRNLNVNVAALLTTDMIERRIGDVSSFDEIIIPGRVRGNLDELKKNINKKIIRGPDELKDLPTLFGEKPVKYDLSKFETSIFGEITDALNMTVEEVITRAEYFRLEGADVIDIGCLPNKKFPHLEEIVQELKNRNFYVSIDSHNTDQLIRGSKAGADYLLSIKDESYHILENLDSYPILIPTDGDMKKFYSLIDRAILDKLTFIADPILDPISYGFT